MHSTAETYVETEKQQTANVPAVHNVWLIILSFFFPFILLQSSVYVLKKKFLLKCLLGCAASYKQYIHRIHSLFHLCLFLLYIA